MPHANDVRAHLKRSHDSVEEISASRKRELIQIFPVLSIDRMRPTETVVERYLQHGRQNECGSADVDARSDILRLDPREYIGPGKVWILQKQRESARRAFGCDRPRVGTAIAPGARGVTRRPGARHEPCIEH